MKRRLLLPLILLALALTACASKPAAPTAADFEVQPGDVVAHVLRMSLLI